MRLLSFAVGAFAVATFLVGLKRRTRWCFCWPRWRWPARSRHFSRRAMSAFLKIFEAIFATETIVFGLAVSCRPARPLAEGLCGIHVAGQPALRRRAVRRFRLCDFLHPGRAQDDRHRRSLFSTRSADQRENLAVFRLRPRAEQARGDEPGLPDLVNQVEVALDVRLSYFRTPISPTLCKIWIRRSSGTSCSSSSCRVAAVYVAAYTIEFVVTWTFVVPLAALAVGRLYRPVDEPGRRIIECCWPDRRPTTRISAFPKTSTALFTASARATARASGTGIYGYSITALQP